MGPLFDQNSPNQTVRRSAEQIEENSVPLQLHAHPFSSYCQKVLIAMYENRIPFEWHLLEGGQAMRELAALWPMKRFPVLVDADRTLFEATCIIEYLGLHYPGPVRLIAEDPKLALETRLMDRFFDNYVATPQQKLVADLLRPEGVRDPHGVSEARRMLDTAYAWLDAVMAERTWAAGETFSLADCAAAPFLFYADWSHPIDAEHAHVRAYRRRLLERPSVVRVVDEARPYRSYFPGGAPLRD